MEIFNKFTDKLIGSFNITELMGADLRDADLKGADLRGAYLPGADLREADLRGADLKGADLREADLRDADLKGADLDEADLSWADLRGADLSEANLEFPTFPSIPLLASMDLGELSDSLTLELMRRDAYAHPHPERFDEWADEGPCPYRNEDRFWWYGVRPDLWKPGRPQMTDAQLILRICAEKGWGIKGYLQIISQRR